MRVLHVCAEIYPFLKTGGLADVAAGLPSALARLGCNPRILVPGFPAFLQGMEDGRRLAKLPASFGVAAIDLYSGTLNGIPAYVINAPGLYDRPGNPYADASNRPYADNHLRFALLGWMAAQLAEGLDSDWMPQVVHGHDWHAGLTPAYMKAAARDGSRRQPGTVFTVHNLAYQGSFDRYIFDDLGLPDDFFDMYGLEFHGQVSFLKAGLFYSDRLTTVSPSYAKEIQRPEQGCGLDGLLHSRASDLYGILNGVDYDVWNPAIDAAITVHYDSGSLEKKQQCKRALQEETGLEMRDDALLFGVVSRLTEQKGLNLVLEGLPDMVKRGGQLVLLGSGDAILESAFRQAASTWPRSVSVQLGYDEQRSHRIIAGSDVILVPSLFEPCGLTQLYSLKYGTLPLVRRIGGLADSVVDSSVTNIGNGMATGFVFNEFSVEAFDAAVQRAFNMYAHRGEWSAVQQNGMQKNFSWEVAAQQFLPLYQQIAV